MITGKIRAGRSAIIEVEVMRFYKHKLTVSYATQVAI